MSNRDGQPEQTLTIRQAYEAMRVFLGQFNERESQDQSETLDQLLSWTEFELDRLTADPAQWPKWVEAVTGIVPDRSPPSPLRLTYDPEANAAYVYLTAAILMPGRDSVPVDPPEGLQAMVVLDWKDGKIVGLEILDVSALLHPDLLDRAEG